MPGTSFDPVWGDATTAFNPTSSLITPTGRSAASTIPDLFGRLPTLYDFGAKGGGVIDDTAAIQAAAASGLKVRIPNGVYGYSDLINFAVGTEFAGDNSYYTEFRALSASAIFKLNSFCRLHRIYLNGNPSAITWDTARGQYGIICPFVQAVVLDQVKVRFFGKYGYVCDKLQNSLFLKCNAQYNKINLALVNGARNITFVAFNCNIDLTMTAGAGGPISPLAIDCRNCLIANITDDPNLSNVAITTGNARNRWVSGIFEWGTGSTYNIEVTSNGNGNVWDGVEITDAADAGYSVKVGGGSQHEFKKCEFNGTSAGSNAFGLILVDGATTICRVWDDFEQGRGKTAPNRGIVCTNGGALEFAPNGYRFYHGNSENFRSGDGGWLVTGGGTRTWNSATQALDCSGASTAAGVYNTPNNLTQAMVAGATFEISVHLTAASAAVWVQVSNSGGRRQIGAMPAGPGVYTFIMVCDGTETGNLLLTAGAASATTWSVKRFQARLI